MFFFIIEIISSNTEENQEQTSKAQSRFETDHIAIGKTSQLPPV